MPNASYWNKIIDLSSAATTDLISENVGFQATGVKVDNYSCYWIYFKDADSYVPPFWAGTILLLRHTTDIQYASLWSPADPGQGTQVFTTPSFFLHLEWTNATDISFAPGQSVAPSVPSLPVHVIVDNFPPSIPQDVNVLNDTLDVNIIGIPTVNVGNLQRVAVQNEVDVTVVGIPTVNVANQVTVAGDGFDTNFIATIVTVGVAAVPCPAVALVSRKGILVQAAPDNSNVIYLGGSTVTADETATGGIQLAAGQALPIDAFATAVLYAISSAAAQKLIVIEGR